MTVIAVTAALHIGDAAAQDFFRLDTTIHETTMRVGQDINHSGRLGYRPPDVGTLTDDDFIYGGATIALRNLYSVNRNSFKYEAANLNIGGAVNKPRGAKYKLILSSASRMKSEEFDLDWSEAPLATTDGGRTLTPSSTGLISQWVAGDTVTVRIVENTPARRVWIEAKESSVTEGEDAVFTVKTSGPAPAKGLAVSLTVADATGSGDFLATANEGMQTATIPFGKTEVDFSIPTIDDELDEPDGDVTATVNSGDRYRLDTTNSTTASVTVQDNDTPNGPPAFTGGTTFSVDENVTTVATLQASDSDPEDSVTGYVVSGGADSAKFAVTNAGALSFLTAPDFENPLDATSTNPSNSAVNNQYIVTVQVASGTGGRAMSASQTFTVTVTDVAEPPSAPEPAISATTVNSLTVTWGAPANTGPPITDYDVQYRQGTSGDFTTWAHVGTARTATITGLTPSTSYEVQVLAKNDEGSSPWSNSATGSTVTNNAPAFSGDASIDVAENSTEVATLQASDTDQGDDVTGYAISGGADSARFAITSAGALTFQAAPDYENPSDATSTDPSNSAMNNQYIVTVRVTSGTGVRALSTLRTLTVSVTDVAEPPAAPTPSISSTTSSSLTVTWTAPANTGPTITDYDVQYRRGTSGDHTAWTHDGTARTATITGLDPSTAYQVQARATNDEGSSAWSTPVQGTTDGSGPVILTIQSATISPKANAVIEGTDAVFTITLSSPATSGGQAVTLSVTDAPGGDFLASGAEGEKSVTIAAGQTTANFSVSTVDDEIEETNGYITVAVGTGTGYVIGNPASARVRIKDNDGAVNWVGRPCLAKFGRAISSQTVTAVTERFAVPRNAGSQMTLIGQPIRSDLNGAAEPRASADVAAWPKVSPDETDSFRLVSKQEFLLSSSFRLTQGGNALDSGSGAIDDGQWTAWNQIGVEHIGRWDCGLPIDSEVTTSVMGVDYERDDWLAGLALTHSAASGEASRDGFDYDIGSTMTAINPYLRLRLSERLTVWGLIGYGTGDLDFTSRRRTIEGGDGSDQVTRRADLTISLGAIGGRATLSPPANNDGLEIALKGDAFFVRTKSGATDLEARAGESSRIRLGLEGSRTFSLAGSATLTPRFDLGILRDGGDAETGTGIETGGSVTFSDPSSGFSMNLRARVLLSHDETDRREWGVSGGVHMQPGLQDRGLSLIMSSTNGIDANDGRLWKTRDVDDFMLRNSHGSHSASRLNVELGYGLPAIGDSFTGTPYVRFGAVDDKRHYGIGYRLSPASASDVSSFLFSVETSRRYGNGDSATANRVRIEYAVRW